LSREDHLHATMAHSISPSGGGDASQGQETVLLLPGWKASGSDPWPVRWAKVHGYSVVEQNDCLRPRRGDWLARLDEVVIDAPAPVVLVAHSLGCNLVSAWATFSRHTAKVRGALLVAPVDMALPALQEALPGWLPIERQPLPFRSIVVGSDLDPYCSAERAQQLARDWSARWVGPGAAGHIPADAPLSDWPQGHTLLQTLLKD